MTLDVSQLHTIWEDNDFDMIELVRDHVIEWFKESRSGCFKMNGKSYVSCVFLSRSEFDSPRCILIGKCVPDNKPRCSNYDWTKIALEMI